jgi:hypothetical protein
MLYICNDQLTRIRNPYFGKDWELPKTYVVGSVFFWRNHGCFLRGFGSTSWSRGLVERHDEHALVWAVLKFPKMKPWIPILIGDASCFSEKLVLGSHKNSIFNR